MSNSTFEIVVAPKTRVTVSSLAEASAAVRARIDRDGIGSSEWSRPTVGNVYSGSRVVARVSYNGRVWNLDGTEVAL